MEYKKWYWLNEKSRDFLSRGYIQGEKTSEQRVREIAETAEKYLGIEGYADKFEDYMSRGWISLSTPVWANYGLERGLPCSCNGSYIEDTMESILGKVAEVGMMTKYGAGTSAYFGGLRYRGAEINGGGKSNGPVHFMEIFDSVSNIVSQSGVRRGSMAAYLPVDHPDVLDFLKIKSEGNSIQGLSIGVCISDEWMRGLLNKDKDKLKIWAAIIQKRFESGYPYIFFSDTANKNAPQCYKDKGEIIHASNLCVTGDTLIEISIDGEILQIQIEDLGFYLKKYKTIKVKSFDIENQRVVYSEILDFAQTGESEELYEIEDEKGNVIKCTGDHKIYTQNRGYVEAKFLEETDILVSAE